jgi:large subunit ribosomal protein L5
MTTTGSTTTSGTATAAATVAPPRLKIRYREEIRPGLQEQLALPNVMMVPRLEKIVLNMGVGEALAQPKLLEGAVADLSLISGQKPVITRAKKSIAAFKIREGMRIGCKVTLRGDRMWHFLDKLFNVVMPRIRDFGGINPNSFDGHGNFAVGLKEQLIFPEIDYDSIDRIRGMDIIIGTTAQTDEEARGLLRALGLPFRAEGAPSRG